MNFHMVNTRKKYGEKAKQLMLNGRCVAAFHDCTKEIDEILPGDVVFLFENKEGIIAYGTASGAPKNHTFEGHQNGGRSQKLKNFRLLHPPIRARTISAVCVNFAQCKKGIFSKTRVPLDQRAGRVLLAIAKEI